MGAPLFLALKGKGRRHCTHYCPRGSFLETFLKSISLDNSLPRFMKTKMFRHIMLVLMMTMFSFGIYHAWGDLYKIAFTIFRFMGVSFLFGLVLGFFTKPKSWCSICPMGHASTLISKKVKKTA